MIRRKKDKITRISIVGFHIQKRELILCQVKAFFDNRGYTLELFTNPARRLRKNIPLFFNDDFYTRIKEILVEELGLIPEKLKVKRLLCFGRISKSTGAKVIRKTSKHLKQPLPVNGSNSGVR
jgi:hypothetical protein